MFGAAGNHNHAPRIPAQVSYDDLAKLEAFRLAQIQGAQSQCAFGKHRVRREHRAEQRTPGQRHADLRERPVNGARQRLPSLEHRRLR